MRKKSATKVRIVLYVTEESKGQMTLLCETFNQAPAAVFAHALARWVLEEPLLKNKLSTKSRRMKVAETSGSNGSPGS